MRTFGKLAWRGLMALMVVGIAMWLFGPYEDVSFDAAYDESQLDGGVDAYLEAREAQVLNIRDNSEKRVIWAGAVEVKTPVAVVYMHGFSASSQEIRPVPDDVAAALGANLIYTRFQGHGRDNDAMGESTVKGWMADTVEALAIARRVGEKVLILSTSTGGTLTALALHEPELQKDVVGVVFVSPNFGVNNGAAAMLTLPAARYWLPLLVGKTRSFEPRNAAQAREWSTTYPSTAVFPMAAAVKAAVAKDYSSVKIPALFHYSKDDKVVRADQTLRISAQWGGPVTTVRPQLGAGDDPSKHVIAGDIISPSQTARSVAAILKWYGELE
jgi:alpha-beta hydrolase superfamily lysophospholipase